MKFVRSASVMLLAAASITACSDNNDPTDVTFDDLVGPWTAQSFVYAATANPALAIDVIGTLNGDLDLTVMSDHSFTGTINVPNLTPGTLPIGGTLDLDTGNETISVDFNSQTEAYNLFEDFTADYEFSNNGQTLTWTYGDTSFDFDGDGTEEDATVTVVLIAQ